MKRGETVTFHTSLTPSQFTETHTDADTLLAKSMCAHMTSHPHLIVQEVNNCFAEGHNCDPWLVFKALSLNLNYSSSPLLPLVKWKCPLFRLI